METNARRGIGIGILSFGILFSFVVVLTIPVSQQLYRELSSSHPLLMGFCKFGLLATTGEIFSLRLSRGEWVLPERLAQRALIWGLLGIAITFMMRVFSTGVDGLLVGGFLPGEGHIILRAFYISTIMNLTFGPTFMALHKCTDKWLEMKNLPMAPPTRAQVVRDVDWGGFVDFTLLKTIPIFWIPAHTITFMLPTEYQVTMAAFLSVALGVILNLKSAADS